MQTYNSAEYKKELQDTARQPGKVVATTGDVDAEFAKGGKIVEAEYLRAACWRTLPWNLRLRWRMYKATK